MEFRDYVGVVARTWPAIVAIALIGALVGLAVAVLRPVTYEATARAAVVAPSATTVPDIGAGLTLGTQAARQYADLATSAIVLAPVIKQQRLDTTANELADDLDVAAVEQEPALTVTASASTPTAAADLANAVVKQLAAVVPTVTRTPPAAAVRVLAVDPAVPPTEATGAPTWLLALTGLAIGLLLALAIGLVRELTNTRIRTQRDLALVTGAPVLGISPRDQLLRRHPLAVRDAARGRRAEDFRTLRTNLGFAELGSSTPSVVVASALAGEGKSTAAANLALSVADLGRRVLLVDGDLRRPRLAVLFRVQSAAGLADVLAGRATLEQAVRSIQRSGPGALDLLPAGALPPNPNELLQSAAMDELLERVHERYDLVVVDSPALSAVSDAAVLSQRTGGTLVVASANRVKRAQLDTALEMLQRAEARVVGVLLTMISSRDADRFAGRYAEGAQGAPTAPATASPPPPALPVAPPAPAGPPAAATVDHSVDRERSAW